MADFVALVSQLSPVVFAVGGDDARRAEATLQAAAGGEPELHVTVFNSRVTCPYSLMFAALDVVRATKGCNRLMSSREQAGAFLERYLQALLPYFNAEDPAVSKTLLQSLTHSFARVYKLCSMWHVDHPMPPVATLMRLSPVPSSGSLASPSSRSAVPFLNALVMEHNAFDSSRSNIYMTFSNHRKASSTFRDQSLKLIFSHLLQHLRTLEPSIVSNECQYSLAVCEGVRNALLYDFMAIIVDETEETFVSQYPSDWRDILCDIGLVTVICDQQERLPPPLCTHLLKGMVGLIGTRRSFFETNDSKTNWVDFFMRRLTVMEQATGDGRLTLPEYCGTLADSIQRFIPPHGYRDIVAAPSAEPFLEFVAQFTLLMFNIPYGQGGSFSATTQLMLFWNRLTTSKRLNLQPDELPVDIEKFLPTLVVRFVIARVGQADTELDDDAIDSMIVQAETLPPLLAMPSVTVACLTGIANELQSNIPLNSVAQTPSSMQWLMYIGGHLCRYFAASLNDDMLKALQVLIGYCTTAITTYREGVRRSDAVDLSVLTYLQHVQGMFSATYRAGGTLLQLLSATFGEKLQLLQFVLSNMGANLVWSGCSTGVVRRSIEVITETCRDVPAVQLAELQMNLPPIHELPLSLKPESYKLRTLLYQCLYVLRPGAADKLEQFLAGVASEMQLTPELLASGKDNTVAALRVGGWLRDLRGVAAACSASAASFATFLEWVLERSAAFSTLASSAAELNVIVVSSLMKFTLQLVTPANHMQSVNVSSHSHNAMGIYLFQFVSGIVKGVAGTLPSRTAVTWSSEGEYYKRSLKQVYSSVEILHRCVTGDFCPFGAMQLYGDNSFDDVTVGVLSLLQQLPWSYLNEYPKVVNSVVTLLKALADNAVLTPFAAMDATLLSWCITFTVQLVDDVSTKSNMLINALQFLTFVTSLFPDVKRLQSGAPSLASPTSPGRITSRTKERIASAIVNMSPPPWEAIVLSAMRVITEQDRALSGAAHTVFPLFEASADLWRSYARYFESQHPTAKRQRVDEMLTALSNNVISSDRFYNNVVNFRAAVRTL